VQPEVGKHVDDRWRDALIVAKLSVAGGGHTVLEAGGGSSPALLILPVWPTLVSLRAPGMSP
jgi:hypothetical protein